MTGAADTARRRLGRPTMNRSRLIFGAWRIELKLFVASIFSAVILVAALCYGALVVDDVAMRREESQIQSGLRRIGDELAASIAPKTNWDDAVLHIDNGLNVEWIQANIASYISRSRTFSRILIVDGTGNAVFGRTERETARIDDFDQISAAIQPLLVNIRRLEAQRGRLRPAETTTSLVSSPIFATGIGSIGGAPVLLTASLVQPDFGAHMPATDRAPVIVTASPIDQAFLRGLAERFLVESIDVVSPGSHPTAGAAQTVLTDSSGRRVATLSWRAARPGSDFLRRIAPLLAAAIGVLLLNAFLLHRKAKAAFLQISRSHAALTDALTRAESADQAKSEFLASISHEIRTPLNCIFGALHVLESEPISNESRKALSRALAAGQLVDALISDVLDYGQIVSGQMELVPASTDLREVLEAVAAMFEPRCRKKGLDFHIELAPEIGFALVDELRLRQCLFHLISNAVKFTADGEIRVRASLRKSDMDNILVVSVSDTGVGVAKHAIARLFDGFTQADGSASRPFEGTGLGLAITRSLAHLMGGDVSIDSEEGRGSNFVLEIVAPTSSRTSKDLGYGGEFLDGVSLLLVDDNDANLTLGRMILEGFGASVAQANGGQAALELATHRTFDLILMDIQMPGMDGLETTRRLRAGGGPNALSPIIAVTANVLEHQVATYRAVGMDGVVAKPISPQDILSKIAALLLAEEPQALSRIA